MASAKALRLLVMLSVAFCLPLGSIADAWACGVCHEDKIAAVYDHAMVLNAAKAGKAVQFAEITGPFTAAAVEDMRKAIKSVPGVDADPVKVSATPASVAFVFDPKQGSSADFLKRINAKISARKWSLGHLKTIGAS